MAIHFALSAAQSENFLFQNPVPHFTFCGDTIKTLGLSVCISRFAGSVCLNSEGVRNINFKLKHLNCACWKLEKKTRRGKSVSTVNQVTCEIVDLGILMLVRVNLLTWKKETVIAFDCIWKRWILWTSLWTEVRGNMSTFLFMHRFLKKKHTKI